MITEWESFIRLLIACILGGIIGYERQSRRKSAGLRTNILVCLGSSLIMVLSINLYQTVEGLTNADPARLAAQVVSGIGFLGAGTIMKEGPTVKGLTTAASLWVVSGVGLAVGAGYYVGAIMATVMVFLTLDILSRIEDWQGKDKLLTISLTTIDTPGQIARIGDCLAKFHISIRGVNVEDHPTDNTVSFQFLLKNPKSIRVTELTKTLMEIDGIIAVSNDKE